MGDGRALGAAASLRAPTPPVPEILTLSTELEQAVNLLGETSFRAAAAGKIRTETMAAFVGELLEASMSTAEAPPPLWLLAEVGPQPATPSARRWPRSLRA